MSMLALVDEIKNEIRINEQGHGFVSLCGAARLLGITQPALTKNFKSHNLAKSQLSQMLIAEGFDPTTWASTGIPVEAFDSIACYYSFNAGSRCTDKAYRLWCSINNKKYQPQENRSIPDRGKKKYIKSTMSFRLSEKGYQTRLCNTLDGKMEVQTLVGSIDILTSTELIEVKCIQGWKNALGQVLAYGHFYPSHQKRIHLIGETQESYLEMIKNVVSKYNVIVTWEP